MSDILKIISIISVVALWGYQYRDLYPTEIESFIIILLAMSAIVKPLFFK